MISDKRIKELMESGDLMVEGIEDAQNNIQPAGLDIHVASDYKRPEIDDVYDARENMSDSIELEPYTFYNVHTLEDIQLSSKIAAEVNEVSSLARNGIRVTQGNVDPGFEGKLVLGVENRTEEVAYLDPGESIAQLSLFELDNSVIKSYGADDDSKFQEQSGF